MEDSVNERLMIEADGLTKVFGNLTAVEDISFTCRQGEIVGFLGPNGAGKTTTMRMLTGYMPPSSGSASIAGYDTVGDSISARQSLGYLPETVPLYPEMRVEDYLAFVGRVRKVDNLWDRVDDVLESVDMLDWAETYIGKLSKGMRQRIGLAQALIHDPDVLILDEPTIGLDPAQIREVRQLISDLGQKHTILLSTHILSEVEQICSRVIMIIDGRIWDDRPISDVMGGDGDAVLTLKLANSGEDAGKTLANVPGVSLVRPEQPGAFSLVFDGADETRSAVAATAVNAGWGLLELRVNQFDLETIFINKLREAELAGAVRQDFPGEGDFEEEE
jgi:ABC-2 type transport system ATP-binding protein